MWVRKTDLQIAEIDLARAKASKSPVRPLIGSLSIISVAAILHAAGFRGMQFSTWIDTNSSFLQRLIGSLPVMVILFMLGFAGTYTYQLIKRRPIFSGNSLLCSRCKTAGASTGLCKCGGSLEPYDYYDWIEEQAETKA